LAPAASEEKPRTKAKAVKEKENLARQTQPEKAEAKTIPEAEAKVPNPEPPDGPNLVSDLSQKPEADQAKPVDPSGGDAKARAKKGNKKKASGAPATAVDVRSAPDVGQLSMNQQLSATAVDERSAPDAGFLPAKDPNSGG
jgi:uncharacterized protein YkwD